MEVNVHPKAVSKDWKRGLLLKSKDSNTKLKGT